METPRDYSSAVGPCDLLAALFVEPGKHRCEDPKLEDVAMSQSWLVLITITSLPENKRKSIGSHHPQLWLKINDHQVVSSDFAERNQFGRSV